MPQPSTTSGAAVASLICGLLFCIPFVTGLLAFILGLVGISSTKNPNVRGRGMAIAGLILGLLSLLGWVGGFGELAHWQGITGPERTFAKTYVNDLLAGNLDKDAAVSTGQVTSDTLQALQTQAQPWGALQSIFVIAVPTQKNGFYACAIVGQCQFASGQHQIQMELVKDSNGNLMVNMVKWAQ
jgi:hypothetical protein